MKRTTAKKRKRTKKPASFSETVAHEHLTIATTLYREMDMRYWLEQAEAELATSTQERKDGR
jgi:hypothetical protein